LNIEKSVKIAEIADFCTSIESQNNIMLQVN